MHIDAEKLVEALKRESRRNELLIRDIPRASDQAPFHAVVRSLSSVIRAIEDVIDAEEG